MAATSVRFLYIRKISEHDPCRLEPAPSVSDWDYIIEGLKGIPEVESAETLLKGTHELRGTYRCWQFWLYPNARIHRHSPKTEGGNGYAGHPPVGTQEDVELRVNGETYAAYVEFV